MKLSTRARYGMRAVIEIAESTERNESVTISQIAEKQQISQKYLETLLVHLKRKGILSSRRGKTGGYLLNDDTDKISVFQIIEALDGPFNLVDCGADRNGCNRDISCKTIDLWIHLTEKFKNEMERISLEDLISNNFKEVIN